MTLFDEPPRGGVGASNDRTNEAAPKGPLRRVVLGVAYDGTDFHGCSRQPGQRTVVGVLAEGLARLFDHEVDLTVAGRTDAGVHALTQVVHGDVDEALGRRRFGFDEAAVLEPLVGLERALEGVLADDVAVWRAAIAPEGFDARRSATSRRYAYDIDRTGRRDPRRRRYSWAISEPLDVNAMRVGTDALLGEHDFAGFCRRPAGHEGPLRRRVLDATWTERSDGLLRFEIEATAFCHQMVRSVVGALVAAGEGRASPNEIMKRLRSATRTGAPTIAPPHGLCLVAVRYRDALGGSLV